MAISTVTRSAALTSVRVTGSSVVRQKAKGVVKKTLVYSGMVRLVHRLAPTGAVILRYHSIQGRPELFADSIGLESIHVTSTFEMQVELIARRFKAVSMDDILLFLKGVKALPRRAVALTFDDGYKDNFQIAAPILDRFGIQATFYVTVDAVDRSKPPWFCFLRHSFETARRHRWTKPASNVPASNLVYDLSTPEGREAAFLSACDICARLSASDREGMIGKVALDLDSKRFPNESDLMMNWSEVRSLVKSGHIVGSHTMTHPNLAHVSSGEAQSELTHSKHKLEKELGSAVVHFSYPNPALHPHWNETTLRITEELQFGTAVTTDAGAVRADTHPLALPRTASARQKSEFLWNVERAFLLPSTSRGAQLLARSASARAG